VHDADDRLVYTIDALGNVSKNDYDAQGRIVRSTAYATPINTAGLGAAPALADVQSRLVATAGRDIVDNRIYDHDGRLSASVDGTGGVTAYTYDANGNVVDRIVYANRID